MFLDAGIVSGNQIFTAQDLCPCIQFIKFQIAVAVNTGVGRKAMLIGTDEP